MLDDDTQKDADSVTVSNEGTHIETVFSSPLSLIANGSQENVSLFVEYGSGLSMMYDEWIRIIDPVDDAVYFDEIVPKRAFKGTTVTLKGCGWIPLDDIKVYFRNQEETPKYVEAEILSKTVEKIKVKVPDNARSGTVYVTAGNKETKKLFFDINSFSLNDPHENQKLIKSEGYWESFSGHALDKATKVYFADHLGNKKAGAITSSDEDSLKVTIPEALAYGKVKIYAEDEDGIVTNEITLPLVPQTVDANPRSQSFEKSITVTLTQEEDFDIFYRIGNGAMQRYAAPLILKSNTTVHAFARVVVGGKNYDSEIYTYYYNLCGENEILQDGVCIVEGEMTYNRCLIKYRMRDTKHYVSTRSGGNTETWEENGTLRNDVTLKGTFTNNTFMGTYRRKQTLSDSIRDDDCTATVTLDPDQNKVLSFSLACNESTVITLSTDSDYLNTYDIVNNIDGQNINEFTFANGFVFRTIGENTCNSVISSKHTVENVTQLSGRLRTTITTNSHSTDRYCDEDSFIWIELWTE